jgi:hypothetical protein
MSQVFLSRCPFPAGESTGKFTLPGSSPDDGRRLFLLTIWRDAGADDAALPAWVEVRQGGHVIFESGSFGEQTLISVDAHDGPVEIINRGRGAVESIRVSDPDRP